MPTEFPILRLADPRTTERKAGIPDKRQRLTFTRSEQSRRLGPTFNKLETVLEADPNAYLWTDDPEAIIPNRALVLKLVGPIKDFHREASRVGLEWLSEDDGDQQDPDEPSIAEVGDVEDVQEVVIQGPLVQEPVRQDRLYVSMPSHDALRELLGRWRDYDAGKAAPEGYGAWWRIFATIAEMRAWGAQDRMDLPTRQYLASRLAEGTTGFVTIEVDLWFRADRETRQERERQFRDKVEAVGGSVLDAYLVEEIHYHAVLVTLPVDRLHEALELRGTVVTADEVMLIRPQSVSSFRSETELESKIASTVRPPPSMLPPRGLLLDGYPLANHDLLRGRVEVVPVDIDDEDAPVEGRYHGTHIASLIVHGDLAEMKPPVDRKLLAVPIMGYLNSQLMERTPPDKLAIGVIHRAITKVMEPHPEGRAQDHRVLVVNHSLGDESRPFAGRSSAWARLIDHLAFKYRLLFVVSAGNALQDFPVAGFATLAHALESEGAARAEIMTQALQSAVDARGILSPAETFNGITVGALHEHADNGPFIGFDPFPEMSTTNVSSTFGLGVNDAIKPDIVLPGGKQAVLPRNESGVVASTLRLRDFGQKAAAPSKRGRLDHQVGTSGTSNAAALATRMCLQIADALDDVFADLPEGWDVLPTRAVLLKALAAHGCRWGDIGMSLDRVLSPAGSKDADRRRKNITRFIGFGRPHPDLVVGGAPRRATMLAHGEIKNNKRHEYRIPLPKSLVSSTALRRVTATLAWASPVRLGASVSRAIALEMTDANGRSDFWTGVDREAANQPPHYAVRKGTLTHVRLSGSKAVPFGDRDDTFVIGVQARAATSPFNQVLVPYALAVTFEVEQDVKNDIYVEIRDHIDRIKAEQDRAHATAERAKARTRSRSRS